MEMGGGVFEVMSTSGDTHLGGTDMDLAIMLIMSERILEKKKVLTFNKRQESHGHESERLLVKKLRLNYSGVMETDINLPFISMIPSSGTQNLL